MGQVVAERDGILVTRARRGWAGFCRVLQSAQWRLPGAGLPNTAARAASRNKTARTEGWSDGGTVVLDDAVTSGPKRCSTRRGIEVKRRIDETVPRRFPRRAGRAQGCPTFRRATRPKAWAGGGLRTLTGRDGCDAAKPFIARYRDLTEMVSGEVTCFQNPDIRAALAWPQGDHTAKGGLRPVGAACQNGSQSTTKISILRSRRGREGSPAGSRPERPCFPGGMELARGRPSRPGRRADPQPTTSSGTTAVR